MFAYVVSWLPRDRLGVIVHPLFLCGATSVGAVKMHLYHSGGERTPDVE